MAYIALFFCFLKKSVSCTFFKDFLFISFSSILLYLGSHDYSIYNPVLAVEHPLQFSLYFSFVKR